MKILVKHSTIISLRKLKKRNKYRQLFSDKFKNKIIINKYYKILFLILFVMSSSLFLIKPLNKSLNKAQKKEREILDTRNYEKNFLNYLNSLKNVSYDNITLLKEYRDRLLKIFSRHSHKNLTEVDSVYMNYQIRFGNQLIAFNKVLFYCELVKCKKIIMNRHNNIYIRNTINDTKFNLSIEMAQPGINYENDFITNYYPNPFYHFLEIRPENKFSVFRDEILRNLPAVQINKNDLYIHIRGGDIFVDPIFGYGYIQPPYCFYKAVINTNLFEKIYIIAGNTKNPVLNKLLNRFPNIIYNKNSLELDISYLARAHNLAGSVSSFFTDIVKLNVNLENLYEYNHYRLSEKIYHLHHLLYNYKRNYTIYLMESSKNYKKFMYIWKLTKKQINILLNDKCPKEFKKIVPN